MAYRTKVILHPQFGRTAGGRILQPHERHEPKLADYLTVPAIETYGVWSVQDILPKARVTELATFANKLETEGWR
jgi:hypothetical protein